MQQDKSPLKLATALLAVFFVASLCLGSSALSSGTSYGSVIPQTGDLKNMLIPIIIVALAAVLLIIALLARKKSESRDADIFDRNSRRGGDSVNRGRHAR